MDFTVQTDWLQPGWSGYISSKYPVELGEFQVSWGPPPANSFVPQEIKTTHVEKPWGSETLLINDHANNLCCKLLHVNAGEQLSMQFHDKKNEYFILRDGECMLHYIDTVTGKEKSMPILIGLPIYIPRLVVHSAEAITDCVILEVSTAHHDDDTFRVQDKYDRRV